MNHIYRLIRSRTHGTLIAVAETAAGGRSRNGSRRRLRRLATLLGGPLVMLPAALAWAAPVGGQVSAGSGQITQNGNTTTIQQGSDRLAINWNSFNVGANESVRFNQPNANAIALNRVLGQDPSRILGNLSANGQVFILNPNGVLFGSGAQVNVGGLVASTLNLSDSDFMNGNGRYVFSQSPDKAGASVINQGSINASGGYIAFLAPQVINQGALTANGGNVSLAAGTQMTLTLGAHSLLTLNIDQGAVDALAANHNLIQADGGVVLLSSKGQDAVLSGVVNNTGVIQARTVSNHNGEIRLLAHGGTVQVDGRLDASAAAGGDGGFIETSGDKIRIADSVHITTAAAAGKTGTWLIDPNDLIIANVGGDISATTLNGQLATSNVTLNTAMGRAGNGDIFVNDALSWNAATTLSLQAERDIILNAAINAAQGGLTLNAGAVISAPATVAVNNFTLDGGNWIQNSATLAAFSARDFRINNGSFLRVAGGDGSTGNAYQIADVYGLQGMGSSSGLRTNSYRLTNDIDAAVTSGWNGGAGFVPVGTSGRAFSGNFDGQGHVISNMTINRPAENFIGLFGMVGGGSRISNIGMVGGNFAGAGYVGPLAGGLENGTISNAYASGNASGNAGSSNFIGGLVGVNYQNGSISQSYATGVVTGGMNVGGLVGWNYGRIDQAYASGSVTGQYGVGGLAGLSDSGRISNSYATGAVNGISGVGGLIGNIQNGGQISNTWASGAVRGSSNVGGLAGSNTGIRIATISASYWDTQTSGQSSSAGGEGRSTSELQGVGVTRPTYVGWDFATVWARGAAYPGFRWQPGFKPQAAGTSITDAITAVLTAVSSGSGSADVTSMLNQMMLATSPNILQALISNKAMIDAENAQFITDTMTRLHAQLGGSGSNGQTQPAVDTSALAAIAKRLDTLIGDIVSGAVVNMKTSMAEINAMIASASTKPSAAGPLDLKAVAPLDKVVPPSSSGTTATAAQSAQAAARAKLLAEQKAASDAQAARAAEAQKQNLQTLLAATEYAKAMEAAAEAQKITGSTEAAQVAQVATVPGSAARIAAVLNTAAVASASGARSTPPRTNSVASTLSTIRPSLRDVLTTAPTQAADNASPTTRPAAGSAASQALLNAGSDMLAQVANMSALIAALLGDGPGVRKP